MKGTLAILLLSIVTVAMGQNTEIPGDTIPVDSMAVDTIPEDTATEKKGILRSKTEYNWGIYVQTGSILHPNPAQYESSSQFTAGIQWRRWDLSGFVSIYEGNYGESLIFPNDFSINYLYAGGNLAYRLSLKRYWELYAVMSVGHGDMIWENANTFEDLFRDKFYVSHLKLRAELTPFKFIRVFGAAGYMKMTGLEITNLNNSDFSGFTATLGIKAGFYSMKILKRRK